jgi:hypothetical protein
MGLNRFSLCVGVCQLSHIMQAQHVGWEGRKKERELQREWRDKQRTLEDELQPKPEPHTFAARMERREQAASRVRGMRIATQRRRSLDFAFFFSFCFVFVFVFLQFSCCALSGFLRSSSPSINLIQTLCLTRFINALNIMII